MHIPEHLNPVIVSLGPLQVHWYGLMYVVAFFVVYQLVLYRIRTEKLEYTKQTISDFMIWVILGILIGGRLGYVFFYDFGYFVAHPIRIISPFDFLDGIRYTGIYGMSYHGGLLGTLTAFALYCRKNKINFWRFTDLFVTAIPLGYTFGRIGNFINGELYGRVTKMPWRMYFPSDLLHQLRHPSQLYEALFEGLLLFTILWRIRKIKVFDGFLSGIYLIGYGVFRLFIEFLREPDSQLGFIWGPFTMGQALCFVMVLAGLVIFALRKGRSV